MPDASILPGHQTTSNALIACLPTTAARPLLPAPLGTAQPSLPSDAASRCRHQTGLQHSRPLNPHAAVMTRRPHQSLPAPRRRLWHVDQTWPLHPRLARRAQFLRPGPVPKSNVAAPPCCKDRVLAAGLHQRQALDLRLPLPQRAASVRPRLASARLAVDLISATAAAFSCRALPCPTDSRPPCP